MPRKLESNANATRTEPRSDELSGGRRCTAPGASGEGRYRSLMRSLRRVSRAFDVNSKRLLARSRISGPQLLCLVTVVELGAPTAREIADEIQLSASTLVGILDRLEAKGLVVRERDAEDRRRVHVTSTPAGKRLVRQGPSRLDRALRRAFVGLPEGEQESIARALEQVVDLVESAEETVRESAAGE